MFVNKSFFEMLKDNNLEQQERIAQLRETLAATTKSNLAFMTQAVKDELSIDWLRHRVNALEKQNAILMGKATGLSFPVPEIVPSRPGTLTLPPNFDSMPSFEDVGDDEAQRLGVKHDDLGFLDFKADHQIARTE